MVKRKITYRYSHNLVYNNSNGRMIERGDTFGNRFI